MQIIAEGALVGMCVRDVLKKHLSLSTKMMKYLKYENNGIEVNGKHCTVRYVLCKGDVLTVSTQDRESSPAVEAVDLPLDILYEDDELVVPAKGANMPTHPSHDHHSDTVANALAYRYLKSGTPFVFRPINRLDRNTSGLLLIARNKRTAALLTRQLQSGNIRKTYLAVLDGEMETEGGIIDACLHRTPESIIVREVCPPDAPDAAPARTEYTVLSTGNGHTLVLAHPITGRTHQLRVHFSHLGYPITGDNLYGTPSHHIGRHALHAYALSFSHPISASPMQLCAPLPQDMQDLIALFFPNSLMEVLNEHSREKEAPSSSLL
ncbi:MAG: RluA family pseudouridine synthase [Ruminococcaceae bacterium]|nr:RluA family pseudouridine synthase [Oscillospiraceae bacterium]